LPSTLAPAAQPGVRGVHAEKIASILSSTLAARVLNSMTRTAPAIRVAAPSNMKRERVTIGLRRID
jgi:hypothetical protein